MIRWFIRRVVKYILEELSGSKEFGAILDRLSSGTSGNRYLDVKTSSVIETAASVSEAGLESDSISRLVGAVVQRSKGIELSDNAVSEKVNKGGKAKQKVIDQLSNLGD